MYIFIIIDFAYSYKIKLQIYKKYLKNCGYKIIIIDKNR